MSYCDSPLGWHIYKRAFDKTSRNFLWKRVVSKSNYKVNILFCTDNIEEIKNKELYFIKLYGRKIYKEGILTNITLGGDFGGNTKIYNQKDFKLFNNIKNKVFKEKISIRQSCLFYNCDFYKFKNMSLFFYPNEHNNLYKLSEEIVKQNKKNIAKINILNTPSFKNNIYFNNVEKVKDLYLTGDYTILNISNILNINKNLVSKILKENLKPDIFNYYKTVNRAKCQQLKINEIQQVNLKGDIIKVWKNLEDICLNTDFKRKAILYCLRNKTSHKNYKWVLN